MDPCRIDYIRKEDDGEFYISDWECCIGTSEDVTLEEVVAYRDYCYEQYTLANKLIQHKAKE